MVKESHGNERKVVVFSLFFSCSKRNLPKREARIQGLGKGKERKPDFFNERENCRKKKTRIYGLRKAKERKGKLMFSYFFLAREKLTAGKETRIYGLRTAKERKEKLMFSFFFFNERNLPKRNTNLGERKAKERKVKLLFSLV